MERCLFPNLFTYGIYHFFICNDYIIKGTNACKKKTMLFECSDTFVKLHKKGVVG